jgi:hypothetical protein
VHADPPDRADVQRAGGPQAAGRRAAALGQDRVRAAGAEDGAGDELLDRLRFDGPFPERAALSLSLPADLKDASGRPLANAGSFPLKIDTGPMPPLAKFAAAPFGIVERFAEGPDGPALMPLTLRRVEPGLQARDLKLDDLQPKTDADIIAWFTRVQRYDNALVPREQAARDVKGPLPRRWATPPRTAWNRAPCRCWPARRACATSPCPTRPRPASARSRSSACRWRRAFTCSKSARRCWASPCSMRPTAPGAPWWCAARCW